MIQFSRLLVASCVLLLSAAGAQAQDTTELAKTTQNPTIVANWDAVKGQQWTVPFGAVQRVVHLPDEAVASVAMRMQRRFSAS